MSPRATRIITEFHQLAGPVDVLINRHLLQAMLGVISLCLLQGMSVMPSRA